MRRLIAFLLVWFVSDSVARASFGQEDFDWSTKWHGQEFAVRVISGGSSHHFTEKHNLIREIPWSAVQVLLGAYMVKSVEEVRKRIPDSSRDIELAIVQSKGVMSFLSNSQQLYEGHVVYQLDDWRPSAEWAQAIWRQDCLAKALLEINEKRQEEIEMKLALSRVPLVEPRHPGQVFDSETDAVVRTEIELNAPESIEQTQSDLAALRECLTDFEKAELDQILASFDQQLASIANKGDSHIATSDERVENLFRSMRDGRYNQTKFPFLVWEDIPALLEKGASKKALMSFPINPFSSRAETEYPEGMVALWLIEGLRTQGDDFPSLNALCLPLEVEAKAWSDVSAENQDRVLAAYQTWWKQVNSRSREDAARVNPLEGTNLHWYGAIR